VTTKPTPARVEFLRSRDIFNVRGYGYAIVMDSDWSFGSLEVLGPASLLSLQRAMKNAFSFEDLEWRHQRDNPFWKERPRHRMHWSLDSDESFDDEASVPEDTYLGLTREGELLVGIELREFGRDRDPFAPWPELERALISWAEARGAEFVSLKGNEYVAGYWDVYFKIPLHGRNVYFAHQFGLQALALARTSVAGEPTLESLVALLRSGQGAALIGLSESQILECKRAVNVRGEHDELEFAKDIAALANSETGGLLIIGMATKRERGRDRIVAVRPPSETITPRRLRGMVDRRVYPPIDALTVESVSSGSAEDPPLLFCLVPPQPEELKPFLVHGAIAGRRVEGAFIGIPRRRGEDTIQTTPASIHSFLVAGRALLRGDGLVGKVESSRD
jgi:Putative DNA-binding domain